MTTLYTKPGLQRAVSLTLVHPNELDESTSIRDLGSIQVLERLVLFVTLKFLSFRFGPAGAVLGHSLFAAQ